MKLSLSVSFNGFQRIRMPKSSLREQWIESIRSHQRFSDNDGMTPYYSVCSSHFEPSNICGGKRLKQGAFPTIFPALQTQSDDEEVLSIDSISNHTSETDDPNKQ